MNKKYDFFLIFSIIFMAVFGLFLLQDYLEDKKLNVYLQTVKDKIAEMIPERDKQDFEKVFSSFVENVDEEKVKPEQLKEFTEKIIKLRQEKDSLTSDEIKEILPAPAVEGIVEVVAPVIKVKPTLEIEWEKLALDFERSLQKGDSIRTLNIRHSQLKNQLEESLRVYTRVSSNIKKNHIKVSKRILEIQDSLGRKEYTHELTKELKSILHDNKQLNENIMALEEIEETIRKEKKKLMEQLKKSDSSRSM